MVMRASSNLMESGNGGREDNLEIQLMAFINEFLVILEGKNEVSSTSTVENEDFTCL